VRTVLDTNLVIATDVAPLPGELAVSAVTVAELHFGVLVARDAAARAERLRRLAVV
jgi:toxin FitB